MLLAFPYVIQWLHSSSFIVATSHLTLLYIQNYRWSYYLIKLRITASKQILNIYGM